MTKLNIILRNRNVIFLLALACGLFFPYASPYMKHLIIPALALAMTLSTMEIGNEAFGRPRSLFFPALLGIVMNYIVLGNIIIGLSALLIRDEMLWTGFVLIAAVPPAIAVIPFSSILRGNTPLSMFGTVGAHLGALAIMPLISISLIGAAAFDPLKLLMISLELIVLPLALSRLLIRKGWKERIDPYRGTITNWSFFLVLYTMIGLNSNLIFDRISSLLPIAAVCISVTFILGFLIDWVCKRFHLPKETRTSIVLLGTLKNHGTAGGIAITFFSQEAALPAAVSTIVMIAYVIWLDFKKKWD